MVDGEIASKPHTHGPALGHGLTHVGDDRLGAAGVEDGDVGGLPEVVALAHEVVEGVALARQELGGHLAVDLGGGVGGLRVQAARPVWA